MRLAGAKHSDGSFVFSDSVRVPCLPRAVTRIDRHGNPINQDRDVNDHSLCWECHGLGWTASEDLAVWVDALPMALLEFSMGKDWDYEASGWVCRIVLVGSDGDYGVDVAAAGQSKKLAFFAALTKAVEAMGVEL